MAKNPALKRNHTPKVLKVEETNIGREFQNDPELKKRFDENVARFREMVQQELDDLDRCRRLTGDDYQTRINY